MEEQSTVTPAQSKPVLESIRNMLELRYEASEGEILMAISLLAERAERLAKDFRKQEEKLFMLQKYPGMIETYASQLERIAAAFGREGYKTYEELTKQLEESAKVRLAQADIYCRVCQALGLDPIDAKGDEIIAKLTQVIEQAGSVSNSDAATTADLLTRSQALVEKAIAILRKQDEIKQEMDKPNMAELHSSMLSCLNTAFEADPAALRAFLTIRIPCNKDLSEHPYVIVEETPVLRYQLNDVGVLGLLNGVIMAAGFPPISVKWKNGGDNPDQILGFCEYNKTDYSDDVS